MSRYCTVTFVFHVSLFCAHSDFDRGTFSNWNVQCWCSKGLASQNLDQTFLKPLKLPWTLLKRTHNNKFLKHKETRMSFKANFKAKYKADKAKENSTSKPKKEKLTFEKGEKEEKAVKVAKDEMEGKVVKVVKVVKEASLVAPA